jgi:hypothetical protein
MAVEDLLMDPKSARDDEGRGSSNSLIWRDLGG